MILYMLLIFPSLAALGTRYAFGEWQAWIGWFVVSSAACGLFTFNGIALDVAVVATWTASILGFVAPDLYRGVKGLIPIPVVALAMTGTAMLLGVVAVLMAGNVVILEMSMNGPLSIVITMVIGALIFVSIAKKQGETTKP